MWRAAGFSGLGSHVQGVRVSGSRIHFLRRGLGLRFLKFRAEGSDSGGQVQSLG